MNTSENYCKRVLPLVEDWLGENTELSFQHDNAGVHCSQYTTAWLEDHGIQTIWWPARSPDLNPIEHLWSWMKNYLYKDLGQRKRLAGKRLKEAILQAWEAVPEGYLQGLMYSMPRRIQAVIQLQAGMTRY